MRITRRSEQPIASSGFTLIEVLVALSIFSVGIVAVLSGIRVTLNQVSESEKRHRATLMLQDLMESAIGTCVRTDAAGRSKDGFFQWQVKLKPWSCTLHPGSLLTEALGPERSEASSNSTGTRVDLLEVTATVRWSTFGQSKSIQMTELTVPQQAMRVSSGALAKDPSGTSGPPNRARVLGP